MNESADIIWKSGSATIPDPIGLHARPAVKLTKLAKKFSSKVEIKSNSTEKWINAKSPNEVMKLRAKHGEPLYVRAAGDNAQECVDQLLALISSNFVN